jgi:hypothetical protein
MSSPCVTTVPLSALKKSAPVTLNSTARWQLADVIALYELPFMDLVSSTHRA